MMPEMGRKWAGNGPVFFIFILLSFLHILRCSRKPRRDCHREDHQMIQRIDSFAGDRLQEGNDKSRGISHGIPISNAVFKV